jgi:hypothetical protein
MNNDFNFQFDTHKDGDRLEGVGVKGRIILKRILQQHYGRTWAGLVRIRIGTSGGLLWT